MALTMLKNSHLFVYKDEESSPLNELKQTKMHFHFSDRMFILRIDVYWSRLRLWDVNANARIDGCSERWLSHCHAARSAQNLVTIDRNASCAMAITCSRSYVLLPWLRCHQIKSIQTHLEVTTSPCAKNLLLLFIFKHYFSLWCIHQSNFFV
jgi:hypothetical protein